MVTGSEYLTEILINNFLTNALKHATPGSSIQINLHPNYITVNNEGAPLPFPEENLFHRFQKGDNMKKGNGLGLAIVKEICAMSGWKVSHFYENGQHKFEVAF